jgi:hypothetical protein
MGPIERSFVMRVDRRSGSIAALLLISAALQAQPPAPPKQAPRRPTFSPYLNLTRPEGGAARNYYGLVRPEVEFRNNISQLQQDARALSIAAAAPPPSGEMETGHRAGYMTHLRYFGTNASRTGAAATAPAAPTRR